MKDVRGFLNNQRGSIIFSVVLILSVLTVIGFHAIRMSVTERHISANGLLYQKSFYAAMAGVEHGKKRLEAIFLNNHVLSENKFDDNSEGYREGILLSQAKIGYSSYEVLIWNYDGEWPQEINAGLYWLESNAQGPRGTKCSIQILLRLDTHYPFSNGYSDFNHSNDKHSITDFTRQM